MRQASLLVFFGLLAVFLWFAAEISVFFYVADEIGLIGAILLMVATSYLGLSLLRRVGLAARQNLFDLFRRSDDGFLRVQDGLRDGALAALGALFLIVPGFLSDALGIACALASSRFWLRTSLPQGARPLDPDVVDLSPQDWRHLDATGNLPKKP